MVDILTSAAVDMTAEGRAVKTFPSTKIYSEVATAELRGAYALGFSEGFEEAFSILQNALKSYSGDFSNKGMAQMRDSILESIEYVKNLWLKS